MERIPIPTVTGPQTAESHGVVDSGVSDITASLHSLAADCGGMGLTQSGHPNLETSSQLERQCAARVESSSSFRARNLAAQGNYSLYRPRIASATSFSSSEQRFVAPRPSTLRHVPLDVMANIFSFVPPMCYNRTFDQHDDVLQAIFDLNEVACLRRGLVAPPRRDINVSSSSVIQDGKLVRKFVVHIQKKWHHPRGMLTLGTYENPGCVIVRNTRLCVMLELLQLTSFVRDLCREGVHPNPGPTALFRALIVSCFMFQLVQGPVVRSLEPEVYVYATLLNGYITARVQFGSTIFYIGPSRRTSRAVSRSMSRVLTLILLFMSGVEQNPGPNTPHPAKCFWFWALLILCSWWIVYVVVTYTIMHKVTRGVTRFVLSRWETYVLSAFNLVALHCAILYLVAYRLWMRRYVFPTLGLAAHLVDFIARCYGRVCFFALGVLDLVATRYTRVEAGVSTPPKRASHELLQRLIYGQIGPKPGDPKNHSTIVNIIDDSTGNSCLWNAARVFHRADKLFVSVLADQSGPATYLDYVALCDANKVTPVPCCVVLFDDEEKCWFLPNTFQRSWFRSMKMDACMFSNERCFLFKTDNAYMQAYRDMAKDMPGFVKQAARVFHFMGYEVVRATTKPSEVPNVGDAAPIPEVDATSHPPAPSPPEVAVPPTPATVDQTPIDERGARYDRIFVYADTCFAITCHSRDKSTKLMRDVAVNDYLGYLRDAWTALDADHLKEAMADVEYRKRVKRREREVAHFDIDEMNSIRAHVENLITYRFAELRWPTCESQFFPKTLDSVTSIADTLFFQLPYAIFIPYVLINRVISPLVFLAWFESDVHSFQPMSRWGVESFGDHFLMLAEDAQVEFHSLVSRITTPLKKIDDFLNKNAQLSSIRLTGAGHCYVEDPKTLLRFLSITWLTNKVTHCIHGMRKRCYYCQALRVKRCDNCAHLCIAPCAHCLNQDINVVNYNGVRHFTTYPVLLRTLSLCRMQRVSNAFSVSKRACVDTTRKVGAYLYGCCFAVRPIVYHCDIRTLVSAYCNRQCGLVCHPFKVRIFFRQFLETLRPRARTPLLSDEDWISHMNPKQKAKMSVLVPKFRDMPRPSVDVVKKQSAHFSNFQKLELLLKQQKQESCKAHEFPYEQHVDHRATPVDPRSINFAGDLNNYRNAKEVATMYAELKNEYPPWNTVFDEHGTCMSVGSGFNAVEVGSWMTVNRTLMPNGALWAADMERFDGKSESGWFYAYIDWMTRVCFCGPHFRPSVKAHVFCKSVTNDGTYFLLNATMKSGVSYTTHLNTLINASMIHHTCRLHGYRVRYIVAGDDSVMCVENDPKGLFGEHFTAVCRGVGHSCKMAHSDLHSVTFLSSYFSSIEPVHLRGQPSIVSDFCLTPEPCRFLGKFGFSTTWQADPAQWFADNCSAAAGIFAAEPQLSRRFGKCTKSLRDNVEHQQWYRDQPVVPRNIGIDNSRRYGVDFSSLPMFNQRCFLDGPVLREMFAHAGYF